MVSWPAAIAVAAHAEGHGAYCSARNLVGANVERISKTELAVIVQAPTLHGAVHREGARMIVPQG